MKNLKKLLNLFLLLGIWNNAWAYPEWDGASDVTTEKQVSGTINVTSARVIATATGILHILSGGVVNCSASIEISNSGKLIIEGGIWDQSAGNFRVGYNYSGSLDILSGTFNASGGTIINGDQATGTINISGGAWNQSAAIFYNGSSSGTGTVNLSGGSFNWSSTGAFYNSYSSGQGNFNISGGSFNWNASSTFYNNVSTCLLNISGGLFNPGAGTFSGSASYDNLRIYGATGRISPSNTFVVDTGACVMPEGSTFLVPSGKTLQIQATFIFRGNIDNSGGGTFNLFTGNGLSASNSKITVASGKSLSLTSYSMTVSTNNTLEIQSGGSLDVGSSRYLYNYGSVNVNTGATFNFGQSSNIITYDYGVIRLYGAESSANGSTISVGSGTFDIGTGTMTIGIGKTLTISSGASFNWNGTLNNSGTFNLFSSNAVAASGKTLTIATSKSVVVPAGRTFGIASENTVALTGGNLTIPSTASFNYLGEVTKTSGTFRLFGATMTPATNKISIDAGQTCLFNSGSLTIGSGKTLEIVNTSTLTVPNTVSLNFSGSDISELSGAIFNVLGDVNKLSGGGFNLFGASMSTASNKLIIDAAQTCAVGAGCTLIIGSGKTIEISSGATLTLPPSASFNFSGEVSKLSGGSFNLFGASMSTASNKIIIDEGQSCVVGDGCTLILGSGKSLLVQDGSTLFIRSDSLFKNLSSSTLEIYDLVKVAGILENGGATAGVINIYKPGTLLIPGGTVINNHINSAINVERGGAILNYAGILDTTVGTCTVKDSGLISNESGAFNFNSSKITFSTSGYLQELDHIELTKDFDLDFTWTITVPATIHGNGRYVNFLTGGAFQINPGASLLLDGVILDGVSGSNICCMDNSGTLSLRDVIWKQDGNYSFTLGSIDILGDVVVQGIGTEFGYASTMTSTIYQNASLLFDDRVTFSYLAASPDLIVMENKRALLGFDDARLYVKNTMRLAQGNVVFDNHVTLSVAPTKTLYFGDKTNHPGDSAYDIDLALMASANVEIYGNFVVDNVVA